MRSGRFRSIDGDSGNWTVTVPFGGQRDGGRRTSARAKRLRQRVARLAALYCANPTWIVTVAYTVTVPV